MANLGDGSGTSIPTAVDTRQIYINGPNPRPDSASRVDAEAINDALAAVVALETDLYRGRVYDSRTFTSIAQAISVIGSTQVTFLLTSAINASNAAEAVTIPATMSILPVRPGVINKGSATLLTINGPVVGNPMHQWLSGFAAGEVLFGAGAFDRILPQWFYSGSGSYSTAFYTAIRAIGAIGGDIYCKRGTYQFATGVVGSGYKFNIIGDGIGATTFQKTANIDMLTFGTHYYGIKGVTFDGNNYTGKCLDISNINYNNLEDIQFKNNSGTTEADAALYVYRGSVLQMDRIFFANNGKHFHISANGLTVGFMEVGESSGDISLFDGTDYAGLAQSELNFQHLYIVDNTGIQFKAVHSLYIGLLDIETTLTVVPFTLGVSPAAGLTGVRSTKIGAVYVTKPAGTSAAPVMRVYGMGASIDSLTIDNYQYDGSGTHTNGHIQFSEALCEGVCLRNFRVNNHATNIIFGDTVNGAYLVGGVLENIFNSSGISGGEIIGRFISTKITNTNCEIILKDDPHQVIMENVAGNITIPNTTGVKDIQLINCTGTITDVGKRALAIRDYIASPFKTIASATELLLGTATGTSEMFSVTGTTAITSIASADTISGRRITLIFAGILTFTDGNNLKLAGNFVTSADSTINIVCDGTNWYEISRSTN